MPQREPHEETCWAIVRRLAPSGKPVFVGSFLNAPRLFRTRQDAREMSVRHDRIVRVRVTEVVDETR